MIPKKIHYCWFGGKELPTLALKCIDSWKHFFPDYEIIEWNETNYDVYKIPYTAEAYKRKKYAFVSDYARFDILNQFGGLYFDTDVEVIKSLDEIILDGPFLGTEPCFKKNVEVSVAPGLGMATDAGNIFFQQMVELYKKVSFIDNTGKAKLKTVVEYATELLTSNGFRPINKTQAILGITIYPTDYFCPLPFGSLQPTITKNTRTIHHYSGSWTTPTQQKYDKFRKQINSRYNKKLSYIFCLIPFCLWQIRDNGLLGFIKKIIRKIQ